MKSLLAAALSIGVVVSGGASGKPAVGYMLDVSRNKVPTMQTMRRIVDVISSLGYDQLQLYFENAFAYSGHEAAWKDVSPFTPDEIRALDALCAEKGIELVPNQNSFGHLENWFRHPEYLHLAELPGGGVKIPWGGRTTEPRALCATSDKSFEFLDGLYRQLLPCFRSKYLNVGCDEVMDICQPVGRSADAIREKGEPRVYLDYLKRLNGLVKRHGHTMMYWADGVVNRDAAFRAEVPKDAIALEWAYEHVNNIDAALRRLKESGLPFYVCPGSSNWLSLSGRFDNMKSNITACVSLGRKYGAIGYLLTDWGDGGHCRPWVASLPSLLLMRARLAGRSPTDAELARAIDRLTGATCGEALIRYQKLDALSGVPWRYNRSETHTMLSEGVDYLRPKEITDERLAALQAERRAARETLRLENAPEWVRDGFELMDLLYDALEVRARGSHAEVAKFVPRYRELWLKYNRPGGLDESIRKNFGYGTARPFATTPPPSGGNDLSVRVVPEWSRITATAAAAARHVYPLPRNARARWRAPGALELPAKFANNPIGCASWDINCKLDLTGHAGLEFDFWCDDISQFSQIRFFLRAGKGWYSVWPFAPEKEGAWCRIRFKTGDFSPEKGVPGLDKIAGIRISGWRNGKRDTTLAIANLSYTDVAAKKLSKEEVAERDRKTREWVRTQPSRSGEHRAFWCHSPDGIGGDRAKTFGWDRSVKELAKNGFNALYVNMAWSGCADYKSAVLPPSSIMRERGDQLEQCLAACRKYGVELHAWKMCWLLGGKRCDPVEIAAARSRGAMAVDDSGKVSEDALCPSNPDTQARELDALAELAGKGVAGVHLDHIRQNGTSSCYCPRCRALFEKSIGRPIADWPADVRKGDALNDKWLAFRARTITDFVRRFSARVRRESPGVKLSAAVFNNPESDHLGLGQDWTRWCREGLLDRVCPMDYTASPLLLKSMVDAQKAAAGKRVEVIPGLGISLWPSGTDKVRIAAEQISVVREAGFNGFIFFNYATWHLKQLEALREGPLRENP